MENLLISHKPESIEKIRKASKDRKHNRETLRIKNEILRCLIDTS
jgi:hypothetical protein